MALHVLIIINSVSREFLCQNSHFTPSHFCKIYDLSRKKRMPSEDFSDEVSEVENQTITFCDNLRTISATQFYVKSIMAS